MMRTQSQPGAILLVMVLVIGSAATVAAISLAMRGVAERSRGLASALSLQAFAAAEACLEEALLQLSTNPSYAGGTMIVGGSSCSVTVTNGVGSLRTVHASATVQRWVGDLTVGVNVAPPKLTILSW